MYVISAHQRYRQTDRQTDVKRRHDRSIAKACSGKNQHQVIRHEAAPLFYTYQFPANCMQFWLSVPTSKSRKRKTELSIQLPSLSSSASWRTVVCMDRHHGTSPITSLQRSKLHRDIGHVLPNDTGSLYLAVDSTHTAVRLFRLLVWQSGTRTHCQMNSEIRRVMSTASNSSLILILFSFY